MPDAAAVRAMFARISPRYDLLNRLLSFGIDRRWRERAVSAVTPPSAPRDGASGAHGAGRARAPVAPGGAADGVSCGPPRRARILDLCSGTGDMALALASRGNAVTAVDFCHEMLALGRRRADGLGPGGPRIVEADALRLPFRDGAYDGATVAFGVRNYEDLDRGLAEAARILRAGGVLAVLEFGRPRGRILPLLYRFYLGKVVPVIGRLVAGAPAAYGYLSTSIRGFDDQETFAKRLERAGFTSIRCTDLTGGIAALYTACKP